MTRQTKKFFALSMVVLWAMTGCATARPRPSQTPASSDQLQSLQTELEAKAQQIAELQNQLENSQRSLLDNYSAKSGRGKSSSIWVSGVTAIDVQKALKRAGFDPGPVDGRFGKKTKKAIKAFQRKNGLTADGIVGEKTWSLLSA